MLQVLDALPAGFLDVAAPDLHRVLPGPTLIHLPGRRPEPLFVSILLHGNETTGLEALQAYFRKHLESGLPRAMTVFVGNVTAAAAGERRLDNQPDYNRIWSGGDGDEARMAQQVLETMAARRVFTAIDVHNNTGLNPHYAIISYLDHPFFHLATLFGRTVVYTTTPKTTCSYAFSALCPAVTVECGLPGQPAGAAHVLEYIEACSQLAQVPCSAIAEHDMDLFHTVATVKVPADTSFSFDNPQADIRFVPAIDRYNFRELAPGTVLARVRQPGGLMLEVRDEAGEEAGGRYLALQGDQVVTARPVMPSMLTLREDIIRLDCLCYFMERLDWHRHLGR